MFGDQSPFDHQFEKIMKLGESPEREELIVELLRHGSAISEPLTEFLGCRPASDGMAPLLELLGKIMDDRVIAVLMQYLESTHPVLRRSAAMALGWNRARASLEKLDEMEGTDPDDSVRRECRAAIEEILTDFPKLRATLNYHQIMETFEPSIAGEHDVVPTGKPDAAQRNKLLAALPRLLAVKYRAVPLHLSPTGVLHIAVPRGRERALIASLSQITGYSVELQSWAPARIDKTIDEFHTLGDDDFCTFHQDLEQVARDEVVQIVLGGVRPDEPCGPLEEANDAVEAAQSFLSTCCRVGAARITVVYTPPGMTVRGEKADSNSLELEPPAEPLRQRFLDALTILARLDPGAGLGRQDGGEMRLTIHRPRYVVRVDRENTVEGEKMMFVFERQ